MQIVISEKCNPTHIRSWVRKKKNSIHEVVVMADSASDLVRQCVVIASKRCSQVTYTNPSVQQALA